MAVVRRTDKCDQCGSVVFKIKQKTGGAILHCIDCDNEQKEIKCDKYQTFSASCEKCESEFFKVRIRPHENNDEIEQRVIECAGCGDIPKKVNVDNEGNLLTDEERELLILEDSIVKAECNRCGNKTFKIKQSVGGVIYRCAKCDNELEEVECDYYETLLPSCSKCGEDIFKVIIRQDEEDDTIERWSAECIKCKGKPKAVYIDNEYKLINEDERTLLIMKDRIEELETELDEKEETISELEEEVQNLNYEIEEKDVEIHHLKRKLEDAEDTIYDLKRDISDKEYEISDKENEISRLKDEVSDLEWRLDR
jgi:uncharacterized coiled-coil protein SlyX